MKYSVPGNSDSDSGSLSKARRKSKSMTVRSGKFSKLSASKSGVVKQSGRIKSPASSNP